ncbi:MAG TPA: hypothetical protein VF245_00600 [Solirubrobacterales bacterium]
MAFEQVGEDGLELVHGRASIGPDSEQIPQQRGSDMPWIAVEKVRKRQAIRQALHFGLVKRTLGLTSIAECRDVEDRPRHRRNRDTVHHRALVCGERHPVNRDPSTRPMATGSTHLNAGAIGTPQQTPTQSGGTATEHRAIPACQRRRHPPTPLSDPAMSHGVDTAMNEMQRTATKPGMDRAPTDSTLDELSASHHAVLLLRERRDHRVCGLPFLVVASVFAIP